MFKWTKSSWVLGSALCLCCVLIVCSAPCAAADEHGEGGHAVDPAASMPLTFDPDLAIFTFIIFVLLIGVLWKFAWGPISEGLDKRERGIADEIEAAKQANLDAKEMLANYQKQLDGAAEQVRATLAQAHKDADAAKQRTVSEAREAAEREREKAVADIEAATAVAVSQLAEKSVELAMGLAGNIVRREIKSGEHADLVRDAVQRLPSNN